MRFAKWNMQLGLPTGRAPTIALVCSLLLLAAATYAVPN